MYKSFVRPAVFETFTIKFDLRYMHINPPITYSVDPNIKFQGYLFSNFDDTRTKFRDQILARRAA